MPILRCLRRISTGFNFNRETSSSVYGSEKEERERVGVGGKSFESEPTKKPPMPIGLYGISKRI